MNQLQYKVSGLVNSQSRTKVLNALDRVEGVQEVAVDIARGTIAVEYNEPASPQEIQTCIQNTGYYIE